MIVRSVVSPLLGANCYVLAAQDAPSACVVVDAGAGVADQVRSVVERHGLTVVAVLATHGHVDHLWDAGELCETYDVALHLHASDLDRVQDPWGTLGPLGHQLRLLGDQVGATWQAPSRVQGFTVDDGHGALHLAHPSGDLTLTVDVLHAPGHTPGSSLYGFVDASGEAALLTGDVLFAGSIGRTDLPGGDSAAMAETLARLRMLPPATRVLPGHGPSSSIGHELLTNPYLA